MIRPLGLMTLYFGYAEYELDAFLEHLMTAGLGAESWSQRPIGQKLALLQETIRALDASIQPELEALLDEVRHLLDRRNALIHGCILTGGRVVSGRTGVKVPNTSVAELNDLAERMFSWKERLCVFRWKRVEPLLASGRSRENRS